MYTLPVSGIVKTYEENISANFFARADFNFIQAISWQSKVTICQIYNIKIKRHPVPSCYLAITSFQIYVNKMVPKKN